MAVEQAQAIGWTSLHGRKAETGMRISMISFSVQGAGVSNRIKEKILGAYPEIQLVQSTTNERAASLVPRTEQSLKEWTGEQFRKSDAIIFIGACGIAVRSIAPFAADKRTDPAVLVIDDCGRYVISLLSGHLGGANAWAERIAEYIGAIPVVTTASDSNKKLAFDLFAEKNHLFITDMRMAKVLESAYLDGERIGVRADLPFEGELPKGLYKFSEGQAPEKYGIYIGMDPAKKHTFAQTLWLIPRRLIAGVGCRKGKAEEAVLAALGSALEIGKYPPAALCGIASIDLKKEEQGISDAVKNWSKKYGKLSFEFYTAEQLKTVEGTGSSSSFVQEITGVDNVCERSALFAAGQLSGKKGKLVLKKQIMDGVTVALAEMERRIRFE